MANSPDIDRVLAEFDRAIARAATSADCWRGLQRLAAGLVGCRLFTVTAVDTAAGVARRIYTSNPDAYPVSGTKPIEPNAWTAQVIGRQEMFVANALPDIAKVFPDHELIGSLGCGAVINLPLILAGKVEATVNILDQTGKYGPAAADAVSRHLPIPAKLALLAAYRLGE